MPVTDVIYDNWGKTTITDRFYEEIPVSYQLTTTAGTIEIEEPISWGAVQFVHKRDKSLHGFNYEFTGTDFDLSFDCDSGFDAIMDEYNLNGNDGNVILRRILVYSGTNIIEFEGALNLSLLKREDNTLKCSVERKSLHQLVNSRLTTKVEIDSDTDLDDNPVQVYPYDTLALPGQILMESYISLQNVVKEEAFTETRTGDSQVYVYFDFIDPTVNTIRGFYGNTLGISGDDNGLSNGNHDIFKFLAAGTFEVKVEVDFQINLRIHPRFLAGGKKVSNAYIFLQLKIYDQNGTQVQNETIGQIPAFNPGVQGFLYPRLAASGTYNINVQAGYAMVVVATVKYGHNANKLKSVDVSVKEFKAKLEMTGTSSSTATLAESRLIKSVMDALFWRVTGRNDAIKSNFYSLANEDQAVDGCGATRVLMNGGAIRSAPTSKFPLTTTIRDMLDSLNAIDCIGMGYELDPTDSKEYIRIEPADYFYNDAEVISIPEVFDYSQETAKDLIYNKIVVGYNKYKEEDENSLDEIHAVHEYQTPIQKESNEYNILSKWTASGYLFETVRRAQFEEDQNRATSYDDDIFIVHVETPGGAVTIWKPVTDSPFDDISGIISPETTINQTLSPKRMLMAHNRWLNSCLTYKNASQLIRNTSTKQNKDYTSTLKQDYCPRGDDQKLPLRAADDIVLSAFGDFDGIYSPEMVTFKARLNMTQVRYIMNAHRGLSPDNNNYGYISFIDDQGISRKGWLQELSYSRDSEEVTFRLLKKKFPL